VPAGLIDEATWRTYLTPDDLEREKVLESFSIPMRGSGADTGTGVDGSEET